MKTKTAYRPKNIPAETPEPNIPEEPPQPSESVIIDFNTDKAEPNETTVAAIEPATPVDEATAALLKQLTDLKKSEQLQREYAQHMAQQAQRPPSREEKLAAWRAMPGADEGDIAFLESHPEMIDRHDVTVVAAEEAAQQGFERGTSQHRQATKENFDRHLTHLQAQQARAQPATTYRSGFFQPPPAPAPAAPDRSSMYAAPVSRRETGSGYREPSPSQIRLSPAEQQIAAASGISDIEYARNKLRMEREKRSGERQ